MLHKITRQLEIDVLHIKDLAEASDLAIAHEMQNLVLHPDLIDQASIMRASKRGRYGIITAIDWQKANQKGIEKFKHLPVTALQQDGFEIATTSSTNVDEHYSEILQILEITKDYLNPQGTIRFSIDIYDRKPDEYLACCEALSKVRNIDYIRTDRALSLQQAKANASKFPEYMQAIRSKIGTAIKLSGNVNSLRVVSKCNTPKYAVNVKQAKEIIKNLKDPKLVNMLNESRKIPMPVEEEEIGSV